MGFAAAVYSTSYFVGGRGTGQTGSIRADGRFVHDLALYQVKAPVDSHDEWDLYKRVQTLPGSEAFGATSRPDCELSK